MHTTPNTGNVNVTVEDAQNDRYRCESVHWSPIKMPHSVVANRFKSEAINPHTNVIVHQWQQGSHPVKATIFVDDSGSASTAAISFDTEDENGHYASTVVHLPLAMIDNLREALADHDQPPSDFTEREYRNERNRFSEA